MIWEFKCIVDAICKCCLMHHVGLYDPTDRAIQATNHNNPYQSHHK
jgi:hypothetical protein